MMSRRAAIWSSPSLRSTLVAWGRDKNFYFNLPAVMVTRRRRIRSRISISPGVRAEAALAVPDAFVDEVALWAAGASRRSGLPRGRAVEWGR
jgi:hypothetical protein